MEKASNLDSGIFLFYRAFIFMCMRFLVIRPVTEITIIYLFIYLFILSKAEPGQKFR